MYAYTAIIYICRLHFFLDAIASPCTYSGQWVIASDFRSEIAIWSTKLASLFSNFCSQKGGGCLHYGRIPQIIWIVDWKCIFSPFAIMQNLCWPSKNHIQLEVLKSPPCCKPDRKIYIFWQLPFNRILAFKLIMLFPHKKHCTWHFLIIIREVLVLTLLILTDVFPDTSLMMD